MRLQAAALKIVDPSYEHMFDADSGFTLTERDPNRPWIVLGREHQTVNPTSVVRGSSTEVEGASPRARVAALPAHARPWQPRAPSAHAPAQIWPASEAPRHQTAQQPPHDARRPGRACRPHASAPPQHLALPQLTPAQRKVANKPLTESPNWRGIATPRHQPGTTWVTAAPVASEPPTSSSGRATQFAVALWPDAIVWWDGAGAATGVRLGGACIRLAVRRAR